MSTESSDSTNHSPTPANSMIDPSPSAGERPVASREVIAPSAKRPPWLDWRVVSLLILAAVSIPTWRLVSNHASAQAAPESAPPLVTVPAARVTREDLYNEVRIPGEFRPYLEVELHSKVSGFVKEMRVDFGDRVKAGQLLAVLEVPELREELDRGKAMEARARADYKAAHLSYTRLLKVVKDNPNLVAQQDLDTAEAKDATAEAAIASAKADVEKYQTLLDYTHITAPFDGVITHRYADPGSLIQAGTTSDTQSKPLVRISDNFLLRLDFPVSLAYVKDIHTGDTVEVRVQSLGNKSFTGTITRSTQRVSEETRKMTMEIEVPNPNLDLVPGMYAEVVLKAERYPQALAIPIEAVPAGQKSSVLVVNDQKEIEERKVSLGLDTPTKYQVLSGLKEGELVLVGSRSLVQPGQKVIPLSDGAPAHP